MPTTLPPRQPKKPPPRQPTTPDLKGTGDGTTQPRAWQGIQGIMLGISLVVLVTLVALPFFFPDGGRGPTLKIAIVEPSFTALDKGEPLADADIRLIRHATIDSMLRALASRQGLRASYVTEPPGADVDEVVRLQLACNSERCRGRLRRERLDGSATWQPMPVRFSVNDLRNVDRRLSKDFKLSHMSHELRNGGARLLAGEDDYQRFLEAAIALRVEGPGARRAEILNSLATVRQRAPRFVDAFLVSADLLVESGPSHHPQAVELLEQAHRIAPGDWRPLDRLLPLIAADENLSRLYFERLDAMLPGDPTLDRWRSDLENNS